MATTAHGTQLHRSLGLDLLRLIAVLLVIGRHAYLPETAPGVLKLWRRAGWMGVDLFFVLSGFLVSSLLFQEYERTGRIALWRFLARRGFKIYPAFWFFIAATIAGMMAVGEPVKTVNLVAELCFVQNYVPGLWNHTWSLAVEEHFYILVGGLMLWIAGRRTAMKTSALVPVVCVGVMVGCGLTRIATWHFMPFTMRGYMFPSHLRFDSLMAGVLLAYLVIFRRLLARTRRIPSWGLLVAGGSLLFPGVVAGTSHPWVSVLGFVPIYFGGVLLTLLALRLPHSQSFIMNLGGKLGGHSYSTYLWHMPVLLWTTPYLPQQAGGAVCALFLAVNIVLIMSVGVALSLLVETPFLRLRDRWFPRGFQKPVHGLTQGPRQHSPSSAVGSPIQH